MTLRLLGSCMLLALLAALAGCGGSAPHVRPLPGDEVDLDRARHEFEDGNYVRAAELLTAFVEGHPGSGQLDQALLLLGLSHQKTGENLLAVEDFNRLVRDFPQSPLREQGEFERAHSHYLEALGPALDPEETETALDLAKAYLLRYPQGSHVEEANRIVDSCLERLAMKAYLNGETYLKLRHDRAAAIYLDKALATKQDFRRAGRALAELARARTRLREDGAAREAWQRLIEYATPERIQKDPRLADLKAEAAEALTRLPAARSEDSAR